MRIASIEGHVAGDDAKPADVPVADRGLGRRCSPWPRSWSCTWALRGAPIGQAAADEDEAEDAPGAGYRDRVVAAIVGGLLLVLAGAYLALTGRLAWSLPAFALGFGIVLTLIAVNRRYRHGSPSLRRTIELANSALTASLIAGILIVVNVLAFRYGGRAIDFTRERTFTLSSLTANQLKSLKRPVTFTVFFGDSPRSVRQLDRVAAAARPLQGGESRAGVDRLPQPVPRARAVRGAAQALPRHRRHARGAAS